MVIAVPSGQLLGDRYRVLEVLGQNRFGLTYLVEDTHCNGEQRTIAEFPLRFHGSGAWERAVELFEQEAALLRDLNGANWPAFRELFFSYEDGCERVFWVQDYVPGQPLRALLKARWVQGRGFSEREGMQLLQDLLPVLDDLHQRGLIHRNLSPDSIILRQSDRQPVPIGFGGIEQVVLTLESEFREPGQPAATCYVGQPGYAPPEQLEKGIVYTDSDFYALAMTVLVMLTGCEPSALRDPQTQALQLDGAQLSEDLQAVLSRAAAVRPSDRYRSAADFLQALQEVRLTASTCARPEVPPAPATAARQIRALPHLRFALGLTLQGLLALSCIVGAAAAGWLVGRFWLNRQLEVPETVWPDFDLLLNPPPEPAASPEALSFPPVDDPEPEPPAALSPAEQERWLALRDRRRELALDHDTYRQLADQLYAARYPDRRDSLPGPEPEAAPQRADYDEVASRLLDQLGQLSNAARSGLGRYTVAERDRWQRKAGTLQVPAPAFWALVTARFQQAFPFATPESSPAWFEQPLGQVWSAIALDTLKALQDDSARTSLVLPEGRNTLQAEGDLAPGAGHIFVARLGQRQILALTALTTEQPLQLLIYAPDGRQLNPDPNQHAWSGPLPATGSYAIALLSQSAQPLRYQFSFTVKNP